MGCLVTVIVVLLVIALAIFIYCKVTKKTLRFVGGHKVYIGGETVHVKNYKKLKEKIREMCANECESTDVEAQADEIINNYISTLSNSGQTPEEIGEKIDAHIEEFINSI